MQDIVFTLFGCVGIVYFSCLVYLNFKRTRSYTKTGVFAMALLLCIDLVLFYLPKVLGK